MAAKEPIGDTKCPLCQGEARIFQVAGSSMRGLMYIRCGEVFRSASTGCGTFQCYGESGQEWIRKNANLYGVEKPEPAPPVAPAPVVEAVADPEPPAAPPAPPPAKKSSLLEGLASIFEDEEA